MPYRPPLLFLVFCMAGICHMLHTRPYAPCYLCYLMIWVLLFPFYSEETRFQRSNLFKVTLLDSDNAGV